MHKLEFLNVYNCIAFILVKSVHPEKIPHLSWLGTTSLICSNMIETMMLGHKPSAYMCMEPA